MEAEHVRVRQAAARAHEDTAEAQRELRELAEKQRHLSASHEQLGRSRTQLQVGGVELGFCSRAREQLGGWVSGSSGWVSG